MAGIVRGLALLVGTFTIGKVQPSATKSQTVTNLKNMVTGSVHMLGVLRHASGTLWASEVAHLFMLVVLIAALVVFAGRMIVGVLRGNSRSDYRTGNRSDTADSQRNHGTESWRIDDLLLSACVAGMIVYVKLATTNDFNLDRYLTAAVIFGGILAGRFVGEVVSRTRSTRLVKTAALISFAVIGSICVNTQSILTQSVLSQPQAGLGNFLESHELTNGIGDYWSASITTVVTNGEVTVRPVIADPSGKIARYGRQSSASWYRGQSFQFLVYTTATPFGVDSIVASRTFGPPEQSYVIGSYHVLVWSHVLSISPSGGYDPG